MPRSNRPPSYRFHKARRCAVVTIEGKNHYLGRYGSPESREKYARLIAEWNQRLSSGPVRPLPTAEPTSGMTVNELILRYLDHAETYYRKNGQPTGELENFRCAVRPLKNLYGRTNAADFKPSKLEVVRQAMIDAKLARQTINGRIGRIRRIFKWGAGKEFVPTEIYWGLKAVEDLKFGRSSARETEAVRPVPDDQIKTTLEMLNPHIAAMVQLQDLTGMRPQDVRNLRSCDLDMSRDVWVYKCWTHKTEHHGHTRRVAIGPRAQKVLKPFLKSDRPEEFVFSPKDAVEELRARRRKEPASPAVKARRARRRSPNPKRPPGDQYDKNAYRRAIARACKKAGVPDWHPHQLRHNSGTRIRSRFGLDAATVVLGVRHGVTTEIYAEADFEWAIEIMREIG